MAKRRIVSVVMASATAIVGVLVVAAVSLAQTEDTTKGAALLAEARKAVGGEDKLAAIKRLQVKGEMRRGQGAITLEGDSEIFIELPDKFRRNESLTLGPGGPGVDRVEVLNGNDAWEENSGGGGRGGFGRGGDFGGGGGRGGNFGGFRGAPGGDPAGDATAQARAQGIDPERIRELLRRNRQTEVARLLLGMLLMSDSSGRVDWYGAVSGRNGGCPRGEDAGRRSHAALPRLDDASAADDDVEWRCPARGSRWTGSRRSRRRWAGPLRTGS